MFFCFSCKPLNYLPFKRLLGRVFVDAKLITSNLTKFIRETDKLWLHGSIGRANRAIHLVIIEIFVKNNFVKFLMKTRLGILLIVYCV